MQNNEPSLTSMGQMVLEIIAFFSQEFENDGRRHFVGFKPRLYFHLNMTSQTQSCRTVKK